MKWTKEQTENRESDFICLDCGEEFLTENQKDRNIEITCHKSECCLCKEEKTVAHIRNFNWLRIKEN